MFFPGSWMMIRRRVGAVVEYRGMDDTDLGICSLIATLRGPEAS